MEPENPLLKRAYALDGNATEIRSLYRDWAQSYDADTVDGMGYVAPEQAAEVLADRLDGAAMILDAGCGTGLVGEALSRQKTSGVMIDGIDLSAGMLERAAQKNVYRKLSEADLTKPLDLAKDSYDGVVSVGVFTSGHVGPLAMDELARIARPGAPVVVTVHEKVWGPDGYADHLKAMEAKGLVRVREIRDAAYHEKEGYSCKLCVLEAA
ncbi:class I SAM-dependent methyltransferase [Stappia sp. ES.058]|uniref:class I SAM-dependent DNA methyltransferase n=1 Tax=Stappia sp. ES.058 TaxID=1881061 RepID=UPI00087B00B3|nr:class I SAM-dependent methyltransferase [Stappia sp. ES.058]SDU48722.1 Methyltransferase domain-containing protein [Stappia sp. ES.058]